MADGNIFFSKGALALDNTFRAIALGTFPAIVAGIPADGGAEAVPDGGFDAGHVNILLTAVAGGATTITHYLARDLLGKRRITPTVTDTLPAGTDVGIGRTLGHALKRVGADPLGTMYLFAKLDVGTATAEVILTGKRG